jgi:DNA-binding SARP family transcriptional activator
MPGSNPATLEIYLLGPFRVAVDGQGVGEQRWSRRKPTLLVKLLALQPHHQLHREQVMELLWPELEFEAASNNLHKAIHMARRALEPEIRSAAGSHFIVTKGQHIVLRAPAKLWIDVEAFEQAATDAIKTDATESYESALALYGGDLLAEDPYEDWTNSRREQLRHQYQSLLAKLALLHQARCEYGQGIERVKELLAGDGTNEEAHRQLMLLYALTGNKQQALRQYDQCSQTLLKELDTEPEQTTRELRRQILTGQIAPLSVKTEKTTQPDQPITSLAILPLSNASDDEDAEYLSDGVTETLINNLSQLPSLKVIARSTVFRFKGQQLDPQRVGSQLGVNAVLTGRVLRRGDILKVQTELVDVVDGVQLWGEQYTRNASDILELQEEIAREIAAKLRLKLSGEDKQLLTKRSTQNTEAYQLYLKGRFFWNKRTEAGQKKGIEYFNQAIEKEPNYALAYTGLADCYASLAFSFDTGSVAPRDAIPKAKAAALKALELDDTLAEARTSLAFIKLHYDWDWPAAAAEFNRAIEMNPNYANAHHWYSHYLMAMGLVEESLNASLKAFELEPLVLVLNLHLGWHYFFARQYDEAIEHLRTTLELEPNFEQAHRYLGWAYQKKEMFAEAERALQQAISLFNGSIEAHAMLGSVYALAKEKNKALKVVEELNQTSKERYVSPFFIALIYANLDQKDDALTWLEKAYEDRSDLLTYLKIDPRLDNLRAEPRFINLLQRVGFTS